jgi:uncharacterized protein YndB with AHSA1/START domain
MAQTGLATVRRRVVVDAPTERAFTVFTDRFGDSIRRSTTCWAHHSLRPCLSRFYEETPTRTRVELEHCHLDRHGPGWETLTDGVAGPEGWPLYLDRYSALLKEGR